MCNTKIIRWKMNIEEAVLECARLGMVPDTPVPVDPGIAASLPRPSMTKAILHSLLNYLNYLL